MKIQIDRIPASGFQIRTEEPSCNYDLGDKSIRFVSPLSIDVRVDYISSQLVVRGGVSLDVLFICSLCLNEFTQKVTIGDFCFDCTAGSSDVIDLTENIKEDIILALPMKPICKTECKGLCLGCGKDLNINSCGCSKAVRDSRFDGLNKLKFE